MTGGGGAWISCLRPGFRVLGGRMPEVQLCPEQERRQEWREFLNSPGVWQLLMEEVEAVRALEATLVGEEEFQPLLAT